MGRSALRSPCVDVSPDGVRARSPRWPDTGGGGGGAVMSIIVTYVGVVECDDESPSPVDAAATAAAATDAAASFSGVDPEPPHSGLR